MNQEHHNPNRAAIQAAHPSVFALPLGAHRVYAALCALLPLDEETDITQERIATFARVSESTVSRSMPLLAAQGLVERRPAEVGAGFVLRLLPLPASAAESRPSTAEVVAAPSIVEPPPSTPEPALQAAVVPRVDVLAEPDPQRNESACMVDHDQDQQQQQQQHTNEPPLRTIAPRVWAEMLRGTPGYDQMQFRQDLATLNRRGVAFTSAVGIIVAARRAGELIYGADQIEAQASNQLDSIPPAQRASRPRRPAQQPRGGSPRKSSIRPPTLPPNHGRQFHGDGGGEA